MGNTNKQGYHLTRLAEKDFLAIYSYGIENFGFARAKEYINNLVSRFEIIAQYPRRYPAVFHIRKKYRKSVVGRHSIYYITEPEITIVRILRSQDAREAIDDFVFE